MLDPSYLHELPKGARSANNPSITALHSKRPAGCCSVLKLAANCLSCLAGTACGGSNC